MKSMETQEGPLTVEEAMTEIGRLGGLQESLRRRTAGVTWMIWGIATPAIFVTYDFLGVLLGLGVPEQELIPWFMFAWAPWVLMGMAATAALWNSAGLVSPRLRNPKQGLRAAAFFFAFFFVGGWVINLIEVPLVEPGMMLGVVALAFVTIGLTGFLTHGRPDRIVALLGGGLALLALLAGALFTRGDEDLAYAVFSILSPVVSSVVYFGLGLQLTLRG